MSAQFYCSLTVSLQFRICSIWSQSSIIRYLHFRLSSKVNTQRWWPVVVLQLICIQLFSRCSAGVDMRSRVRDIEVDCIHYIIIYWDSILAFCVGWVVFLCVRLKELWRWFYNALVGYTRWISVWVWVWVCFQFLTDNSGWEVEKVSETPYWGIDLSVMWSHRFNEILISLMSWR